MQPAVTSSGTSAAPSDGSSSSTSSSSSTAAVLPVSVLGQPYLAAQGGARIVVGATKRYGLDARQALALCHASEYAAGQARGGGAGAGAGAGEAEGGGQSAQSAAPALGEECAQLLDSASGLWAPLASCWEPSRVRCGHGTLAWKHVPRPHRRWQ